jgi:hypothetical protein
MSLTLVALLGALSAVLVDPVIGLPVAGAALAGLTFGGRTPVSVVVALTGGAIAGGVLYGAVVPLAGSTVPASEPYVFTALLVASLLAVGPVAAAVMRRRSALETMAGLTVVLSALSIAELAFYAMEAQQSLDAYMQAAVQGLMGSAGISDEVLKTIVSMWPGAIVTVNALTAVLVVLAVGFVGARLGVALRRMPPLAVLDLDARMAILPIVAIALLAAGRLPVSFAPTLDIVGKNLLMVARMVFFLQGVAVFAGLYERAKFSRPARIAGFVLLGVTEAFAPAVSLTGLADIWLNLRRLPRDGSAPASAGGAPGQD